MQSKSSISTDFGAAAAPPQALDKLAVQKQSMQELWRNSSLSGSNAGYIENIYEEWLQSPNSVPVEWRSYFEQLPRVPGVLTTDIPHSPVLRYFSLLGRGHARPLVVPGSGGVDIEHERKQVNVLALISSYRSRGHQKAQLDPLGLMPRIHVPDLELAFHHLSPADLDTVFQTGASFIGPEEAPLRNIIEAREQTYCHHVGSEIAHVTDLAEKQWIQQRLESVRSKPVYTVEIKKSLLERLTAAEGLERHLDSKYPGTKRFGLEGAESLVPMLDQLLQRAGGYGAKEVVIGMPHRGRLNVLVNILGKSPKELFQEFEGKKLVNTSGDVKYHQGFSSNVMTSGGELHLAMAFNPSHLEIVAPVVEGSVRARQDRRQDQQGKAVLPIIMHGDAAFAGQGVVMETFQMSQTRGFRTGGTVHIVVNNQVGFTTSWQEDARSTEYCTDVAKMVQAPIFHVNGDDPEAVLFVAHLALDYRYTFHKDVVIDLVCYRRRGHNEADEPSGTQPLMYQKIAALKTTRALYAQQLVNENVISAADADAMIAHYRDALDKGEHVAMALAQEPDKSLFVDWAPYLGHDWTAPADTGFDLARLQELGRKMCATPDGVVIQRQVEKIYDDRRLMIAGSLPINWGMAEMLAYATLLDQGHNVRLTGQDVGRGTFSHRHAVIHNQKDDSIYVPLQHIEEKQAVFDIYDSFLSEEAVLGFEYGYATTTPSALVVWEAQFGDFANGAQVVIDQFLTSGEQKWGRLCGLTLLLPHGYEGQGPEHSSARLERYMQLCAQHNIQVICPTTPAQIFHALRRQVLRPTRKPLVVMSPKWLLRYKLAVSSLEDLAHGSFQLVIDDFVLQNSGVKAADVERVILCSGKVYYHLLEARTAQNIQNVAVLRVEQLYPFPDMVLESILQAYAHVHDFHWCQEEPMNQGAWYSSQHHMRNVLQKVQPAAHLQYTGRAASAAPAAGYMSLHLEEQERFVTEALTVK